MIMHTLSSSATIMLKIFLPIFWFSFFGAFALALWFAQESSGSILARNLRYGILVFLAIGLVLMWISVVQLKRVEWDDNAFIVSNYRKHVKYPLGAIQKIKETDLLLFKLITLRPSDPRFFGKKIHFIINSGKLQQFLNEHPDVVAHLDGKTEE